MTGADEKKLDAFEMDIEIRRLRALIDLSCVEDVEFLRRYVELLEVAYMQQAATLCMQRDDNRQLWE